MFFLLDDIAWSSCIIFTNTLLLPPAAKRVELINYSGPKRSFGLSIAPIASSVGRNEAPKALSESHRSLPQGNHVAVSDILDKKTRLSWKQDFSRLSRKSDTSEGFPWGSLRWDSLSAFSASFCPTILAIIALAPPKASL